MSWVASDIMTRDVICVREDMDLRDLTRLFLEKSITGAPVVTREGALKGVVSQTDLLNYSLSREDELVLESGFYETVRIEGRHLPGGFQIGDANTARVADVMTPVVHSVRESTPLETVARLMMRNHIHRVIVRQGKKVSGIISALDVMKALTMGKGDLPKASRPKKKLPARPRPARARSSHPRP